MPNATDQPGTPPAGLYRNPVLIIDPGVHTSRIWCADAAAEWAVTGSDDKTVRVWSLSDGTLVRTIRLPAGPGHVGEAYAVAISPDGVLIAVGGWTRWTDADRQQQIYLFDRASGKLVQRTDGLPSLVTHLAFSPDGQRLAAAFGSTRGLRIYSRNGESWAELGRDENYGAPSYWVAFASDGRLATTSMDGNVRLYAADCQGKLQPTATRPMPGDGQLYSVAFSPDGAHVAAGFAETTSVVLFDSRTLVPLPGPDLAGLTRCDVSTVAWSDDGTTLFAAGTNGADGCGLIVAWADAGTGARRALPAGRDTVNCIVPLSGGDLLVAAADPWFARLLPDGSQRWTHGPPKCDFREQFDRLSVASDGQRVDFGFAQFGKLPARFDLAARTLCLEPAEDKSLTPAKQGGLPILNWRNTNRPTFNGQPLPLEPRELSRSLAIHPSADCFVLGSEWSLRAFDAKGAQLWSHPTPGDVWAVTISGDGTLAVQACGDGTIRWHRMDNGRELLAFMALPDQINWVAWTPEGFYAATPGARGVLRWHANRGWDEAAESVAIEDIKGSFRPSLLPLVLEEKETTRALGRALSADHDLQVTIRTNSRLPEGARLCLLTIGISEYNPDRAGSLQLRFAHRDASELALAVLATQDSLYKVEPQCLTNEKASRDSISRALEAMQASMTPGRGDLAVVHFSGHGALVNGRLYLLPYDVDARDAVGIRTTGWWIDELKGDLLALASLGRVLVLLDACHSGAMTMDGAALALNSTDLRVGLAAANVMVLTSSSGSEVSQESPEWQHGAFTKALLESFASADTDHDGLIGPTELAEYVDNRVRWLTNGAQTPGLEVRFNSTLFAAQL